LVGQKADASGQRHITYEITNETRNAIELTVLQIEARHESTGWWVVSPEWRRVWHLKQAAGVVRGISQATLNPLSSAQFEVLPPLWHLEGTAVRGQLQSMKVASS